MQQSEAVAWSKRSRRSASEIVAGRIARTDTRPGEIASSWEMKAYFRNHDASHVVFGTTTEIAGKAINDMWTFLAMHVTAKEYVVEFATANEAKKILSELQIWATIKAMVADRSFKLHFPQHRY